MEFKAEDGESFDVTITRNWINVTELWVKTKYRKHASIVAIYLPEWL